MALDAPDLNLTLKYRIVATSTTKPGDLIIEGIDGTRWLFFGSTGTASRAALDQIVVESLMDRQRWQERSDSSWLTLEEVRRLAADAHAHRDRRFLRGLVGASNRH